jgi:hypothetical protein
MEQQLLVHKTVFSSVYTSFIAVILLDETTVSKSNFYFYSMKKNYTTLEMTKELKIILLLILLK